MNPDDNNKQRTPEAQRFYEQVDELDKEPMTPGREEIRKKAEEIAKEHFKTFPRIFPG